jgi:hypothetical protein
MGEYSNRNAPDHSINAITDAFQGQLSLHLVGSFEQGGIAEFRLVGHGSEFVMLPSAPWAPLAILAAKKIKSLPVSLEWFLTAKKLASAMAQNGVIVLADEHNATRIVYRLRRRIDGTATSTDRSVFLVNSCEVTQKSEPVINESGGRR